MCKQIYISYTLNKNIIRKNICSLSLTDFVECLQLGVISKDTCIHLQQNALNESNIQSAREHTVFFFHNIDKR